ncbi:MAG TPA: response regulator [Verrucomicrobiae bacterium]|jgi:CheY-like chemotaxis protein|nr:response regulator [Verrucomicrobiae bacterium]
MSASKIPILLIEDDENDIFFLERALEKAGIPFSLHTAVTGQEALDYLGGVGKFSDRSRHPLPSFVFLDLKMPQLSGFEMLVWMRAHPDLKDIPVVVLTSSGEERDRQRAIEFGVKAYLVKPPTADMMLEAVRLCK